MSNAGHADGQHRDTITAEARWRSLSFEVTRSLARLWLAEHGKYDGGKEEARARLHTATRAARAFLEALEQEEQ